MYMMYLTSNVIMNRKYVIKEAKQRKVIGGGFIRPRRVQSTDSNTHKLTADRVPEPSCVGIIVHIARWQLPWQRPPYSVHLGTSLIPWMKPQRPEIHRTALQKRHSSAAMAVE